MSLWNHHWGLIYIYEKWSDFPFFLLDKIFSLSFLSRKLQWFIWGSNDFKFSTIFKCFLWPDLKTQNFKLWNACKMVSHKTKSNFVGSLEFYVGSCVCFSEGRMNAILKELFDLESNKRRGKNWTLLIYYV